MIQSAGTVHTRVPFVDLQAQMMPLRSEIERALSGVVESGDFILGSAVDEFESAFAHYCGVAHGIGVDSGLSAIEISLRALGIGGGDEVITQANTFLATVAAIMHTGGRPVLVDCDDNGVIDVAQVADAMTPRTRAVVPVHLFGRIGPVDELVSLARAKGVHVVEDAAQAHGAWHAGKRAGSFGVAGAFSFYPAKNLGALGDGGMLVTDSEEVAAAARAMRNYGQVAKNVHTAVPMNRRLDTLQAAVLSVKLPNLDRWNERRREIADRYRAALDDLPLVLPNADAERERHVYHLFPVVTPERDRLRSWLEKSGIATGMHYPTPPHLQPALRDLGYTSDRFPVAERLAVSSLSLPMYETMMDQQVDTVAEFVTSFFAGTPGR